MRRGAVDPALKWRGRRDSNPPTTWFEVRVGERKGIRQGCKRLIVVVMLAGRPLQDPRASTTEQGEAGRSPAKVPRVHGYNVASDGSPPGNEVDRYRTELRRKFENNTCLWGGLYNPISLGADNASKFQILV
jgi:hypothetical protein